MTLFEMAFWPLWLLAVWFCQDKRMIRFQCWMADLEYELARKAQPSNNT